MKLSSLRIVGIAIPVIATLIVDACFLRFIERTHGSVELNRSLIAVGAILVVTAIIVALYLYGCVKIVLGWMILALSGIFSFHFVMCLREVPVVLNVPLDWLTLVILALNLVAVGNMAIFWRAPEIVTQFFLITIAVLIALLFRQIPDWTVWLLLLLGLLVICDICVVLCPQGSSIFCSKRPRARGRIARPRLFLGGVFHGRRGR
jgi:presenilin 1